MEQIFQLDLGIFFIVDYLNKVEIFIDFFALFKFQTSIKKVLGPNSKFGFRDFLGSLICYKTHFTELKSVRKLPQNKGLKLKKHFFQGYS